MPFFQYKAVTADGKVVEGTLEAADQRTVLTRLQQQGQLPIRIDGEGKGLLERDFKFPWQRNRVSRHDLLIFTQELSTLLQAGLPLDRSLSILSDLTENAYLQGVVKELLREIKGGKSLSEAMVLYPQIFPKLYVNMVRAGEISGTLNIILERVNEYLEEADELRSYFISSLIYPAILAAVGIGSIIIIVTFVIPNFAEIFESAGTPVPLPMKIMLWLSGIVTGYWWLFLLLAILGGAMLRRYLNTDEGRLHWDTRLLTLPLLGDLYQKMEVSRFSRTLGTLLKSSVPLIQSINIVREVVGNRRISSAMEGIKQGVKKGEGLSRPVKEANVFPPFAVHLLEVGEETGRLDDMLLRIADAYDREIRTAIKRLLAAFEPAIILIIGLIIGVMVVSMLYSIFSIHTVPI